MYENKRQPLASRETYYRRIARNFFWTTLILVASAGIGTLGFYFSRDVRCRPSIQWIDAFHNACMLLSGMGPVIHCYTLAGKWFSSLYAMYSGVVLITNVGFLLSPAIHRFYHKLHLEE